MVTLPFDSQNLVHILVGHRGKSKNMEVTTKLIDYVGVFVLFCFIFLRYPIWLPKVTSLFVYWVDTQVHFWVNIDAV